MERGEIKRRTNTTRPLVTMVTSWGETAMGEKSEKLKETPKWLLLLQKIGLLSTTVDDVHLVFFFQVDHIMKRSKIFIK